MAITAQIVETMIAGNNSNYTERREWYDRYTTDTLPVTTRPQPVYLAEDKAAPFNKLVNSYDTEIVDNRANYLLANSVVVAYVDQAEGDDAKKKRAEFISDFYRETGFNGLLLEQAKSAGAGGASAVLAYQTAQNTVQLMPVEPWEYIVNRNADMTETESAVRYWYSEGVSEAGKKTWTQKAEYYTATEIFYFTGVPVESTPQGAFVGTLTADLTQGTEGVGKHDFGYVPLVELSNNVMRRPSFYKVISLIDAYNRMNSDMVDEMESFRHAYLLLTNYCADPDVAATLRNARALQVDKDGDAKFITKDIKPEAYNLVIEGLAKNIERFSGNLNYSDPDVYGNATNLAISTRVKPLENQAKALWYQVETMLDDLFKGITEYWNKAGTLHWDWRKIHYTYVLDKPINEVEIADTAVKYREVGLSFDTVAAQIPFVKDPKEEAEKLKIEREEMRFTTPPPDGDGFDN